MAETQAEPLSAPGTQQAATPLRWLSYGRPGALRMLVPGEHHVATSLLSEKMSRPAPLMIPRPTRQRPVPGTRYWVSRNPDQTEIHPGDHALDAQLV